MSYLFPWACVCLVEVGVMRVFSPLGSDPDSAVKPKPYIMRLQLNPIMSVVGGLLYWEPQRQPGECVCMCVTETSRDHYKYVCAGPRALSVCYNNSASGDGGGIEHKRSRHMWG